MAADNRMRRLPGVDSLVSSRRVQKLVTELSHDTVVLIARDLLADTRARIITGEDCPSRQEITTALLRRIQEISTVAPRPVINATGVIIHTNLGRAPLCPEAITAMRQASSGFTNLEIDLETGKRGSRNVHLEKILCQITGAEDALAVNNNASGILLALSSLTRRKEVIVSRGQAVEIGGKFRIPDVMRQSGTRLVEVGTTNKTYLADYEEAITERTAALLRVHSSNFKVIGFAEEVPVAELAGLGARHGLMVLDDLGSGCLLDTTPFGLDPEPRVQDSISAGADLAMFSGDKLLGGPQAGLIVGRKELVSRLKQHPLSRAVRIDKTRLAGLSATLLHYLKGNALERIPVWRMIAAPLSDIENRAHFWASQMGEIATVIEGESTIGGGSLPGNTLPTRLVSLRLSGEVSARNAARHLRQARRPVITRIEKNRLILDPRSVDPSEDRALLQTLKSAFPSA